MPAEPAQVRTFGQRRGIFPIDAESGGTWAAVNDAAVSMALLNDNPRQTATFPNRVSRGLIIPGLLHCDTVVQATELAREIDPHIYAPFRLVMFDNHQVVDILSDGTTLTVRPQAFIFESEPMIFMSSGLGDHLVEGVRRQLFDAFFTQNTVAYWPARQNAFHRHQLPDMTHLSICTSRENVHTVSFTAIERRVDSIRLVYWPGAPDRPTAPMQIELNTEHGVVSA